MIKRVNAILFRFLVCVMVFSASMVGQSYADPSGSFEVPEVNDDFTKVNPNQGMQTKKEEDQTTWLGKLLKWTGAAKDQKGLEKLSEQANNEFFDGFIKKSAESLLGYDLYTGEPLKGERKKDADRTLSGVVDCIPVISNIKSFIDFTSGKDTISGDNLDPVDKVITVIGIASGPGKKAGTILKGVLNGGKKFLKRFGIRIDDLADRLGLGPRLQPAGGPPDIPRKPQVNKIEGTNGGGGSGLSSSVKRGIGFDTKTIVQDLSSQFEGSKIRKTKKGGGYGVTIPIPDKKNLAFDIRIQGFNSGQRTNPYFKVNIINIKNGKSKGMLDQYGNITNDPEKLHIDFDLKNGNFMEQILKVMNAYKSK